MTRFLAVIAVLVACQSEPPAQQSREQLDAVIQARQEIARAEARAYFEEARRFADEQEQRRLALEAEQERREQEAAAARARDQRIERQRQAQAEAQAYRETEEAVRGAIEAMHRSNDAVNDSLRRFQEQTDRAVPPPAQRAEWGGTLGTEQSTRRP